MKKSLLISLIFIFIIAQTSTSTAGPSLKVNFREVLDTTILEEDYSFYSETYEVGTSQSMQAKKNLIALSKTSGMKAKLIKVCKYMDMFNARVKVIDARGATSGLSNLKSVSVSSYIDEVVLDLPDYSAEEEETLSEYYDSYEDYPDYIEDGYVYYSIEGLCTYSTTVSLTSSNAYRIYIGDLRGPEYSRAELTKLKWTVTLVND